MVQAAISAVIVVGVFAFAVPRFASYSSAWAVLRQLSWAQLGLLLALAALNLVTYWPRAMAALPGLGFWQAAVRYQTTSRSPTPCPPVACWRWRCSRC